MKKVYKKKKYLNGGVVGNADPTTVYANTRKKSELLDDNNFNTTQEGLANRDLTLQKQSDATNMATQNVQNVQAQKRSNTAAVGAATDTIMSAVGDIPLVGSFVKAGTAVSGITDKASQNRKEKTGDAGAGGAYSAISNVVNPGESLLTGIQSGNATDIARGLLPGVAHLFTKEENTAQGKAFSEEQYQKQKQKELNKQIEKYGAVDNTMQSEQAKHGKKHLKYKYKKGEKTIKMKIDDLVEEHEKLTSIMKSPSKKDDKKELKYQTKELKEYKKLDNKEDKEEREIETEGREPIFSPKKNDGTRDLLYYNPSAPTHKEGGVKAKVVKDTKYKMKGSKELVIPEGSAIITAKDGKNKQALVAYKKGDYKKLDKVINQMPEDNPSKKKIKGVLASDINEEEKGFDFTSGEGVKYKYKTGTASKPVVDTQPTNTKSKINTDFLLGSATGLYNLGRGLFEKPTKTNRRYVNNEQYKYKDLSEPSKQAVKEQYLSDAANIKNVTGGSSGSYLGNMTLATNQRRKGLQEINTQESARKLGLENQNVDLRNQQKMANLELANRYDDLDLQNRARRDDYIEKGITQTSDVAVKNRQLSQLNKNRANRDDKTLASLGTEDYTLDKDGNIISRKAKGTKMLKYKMKK